MEKYMGPLSDFVDFEEPEVAPLRTIKIWSPKRIMRGHSGVVIKLLEINVLLVPFLDKPHHQREPRSCENLC